MPPQSAQERLDAQRAYRLRDQKKRRNKVLSAEDARWLAGWDATHPPRGRRRPVDRGAPLEPGPAALPVQSLPTSSAAPKADESAPPPLEGAAVESEAPPTGGPPPLDASAQPETPPGPALGLTPEALGALGGAMVAAELENWRERMPAAAVAKDKAAVIFAGAFTACARKYLPADGAANDEAVAVIGAGVIFGGPMLRGYLDRRDEAKANELHDVVQAQPAVAAAPPQPSTPPPAAAPRASANRTANWKRIIEGEDAGSGYGG